MTPDGDGSHPTPEVEGGEGTGLDALQGDPGFWGEFRQFLDETRNWWLAPLLVVFLLLSLLVALSETSPLAPFVYTLF